MYPLAQANQFYLVGSKYIPKIPQKEQGGTGIEKKYWLN